MRINFHDDATIDVQMAPLIDCVFLLLIFFLVATTLKKIDEELPLTLPDSEAAVEVQQPDEYTVISIDPALNYYLDGAPASLSLLQSTIRNKARDNRDLKVRLDIDRGVPFQEVMQVLDMLRFEDLHNIGFKTYQDHAAPKAK